MKFKLPTGHKERDVPLGQGVLEQLDAYVENYRPVKVTLPWGEQDSREEETVNLVLTDSASRPCYATLRFVDASPRCIDQGGFKPSVQPTMSAS